MIIRNDGSASSIVWLTVGTLKCQTKIKSLWGDNKATTDKYLLKSMEGVKRIT